MDFSAGSPFTAKVTSPAKVKVLGGWDALLDHNCRMPLMVNERKCFDIDCSEAGPGGTKIVIENGLLLVKWHF